METIPTLQRLTALPKAEVHVHLEGTFEPATLAHWAREAKVDVAMSNSFGFGGTNGTLVFRRV